VLEFIEKFKLAIYFPSDKILVGSSYVNRMKNIYMETFE